MSSRNKKKNSKKQTKEEVKGEDFDFDSIAIKPDEDKDTPKVDTIEPKQEVQEVKISQEKIDNKVVQENKESQGNKEIPIVQNNKEKEIPVVEENQVKEIPVVQDNKEIKEDQIDNENTETKKQLLNEFNNASSHKSIIEIIPEKKSSNNVVSLEQNEGDTLQNLIVKDYSPNKVRTIPNQPSTPERMDASEFNYQNTNTGSSIKIVKINSRTNSLNQEIKEITHNNTTNNTTKVITTNTKANSSTEEVSKILGDSALINSRRMEDQFKALEALEYSKSLYNMCLNFFTARDESVSSYNYYFNYIFSMIGPNFESQIPNKNFFHYLVQAFLLEIFKCLKKASICGENVSYYNIVELIKNSSVSEKSFLLSLGYLTETINYSDNLIINGIFNQNMYSNTISIIKRTLSVLGPEFFSIAINLIHNSDLLNVNENLDRQEFEAKISELMLLCVNHTLNELESNTLNNIYVESFKSFKNYEYSTDSYTLESFTEKVKDNYYLANVNKSSGSSNSINSFGIKIDNSNECESFYYFSLTSFDELKQDIELFTNYSSSIIKKVKNLLKNKYITVNDFIYGTLLNTRISSMIINTLRLNKLLDFCKFVLGGAQDLTTTTYKKVKVSFKRLNEWVDSSFLKEVKNFPFYTYSKVLNTVRMTNQLLLDNLIYPVKNVTFYYSEGCIQIIITNVENAKDKANKLRNYLVTNIERKYLDISEYLQPTINDIKSVVSYDNDRNYLNIKINKKIIEN